jgi:hypothetical protein
LLATRGTVKRPYTRELIDRFANECQIAMLGSAELVEMAEAKLHGRRYHWKSCVVFFVRGCGCRSRRIPLCWAAPTSLYYRKSC